MSPVFFCPELLIKCSHSKYHDAGMMQRRFSQASLKVGFSAAVSVLENYSCTAKTVSVNCAEINAAGTYNLPVNISLPKNMTLVEKSSDTVSVTVVEKIKEQQEIIEDEKDDDFSSGDMIEDKITVLDKKQ